MNFKAASPGLGAPCAPDPWAEEWADPSWQDARLAELVAEWRENTADDPDAAQPRPDASASGDDGDEVNGSAVHELIVGELSGTARAARAMVAEQYRLIAELLAHAAAVPEPWVGPDPTSDAAWVDPRGRTVDRVRSDRREFAVRAAAMDAAARLTLTESVVRARAAHAHTLATRCPRVWAAFLAGDVTEQNATVTAQLAQSLPDDDPDGWAVFDEGACTRAVRLTPAKFRVSARALRERVHAESIEARHRRAKADRGVWMTPELDGMATLTALLPAADARAAMNRLDAVARHLRGIDGETRTLAQLRADIAADLLTGSASDATTKPVATPSVAITIPALSLLGQGDEPATLEGYGPIDLDTAKRLAGAAKSWVRILTHPVTGVPLTMDRRAYRVPVSMKRWLGVVEPTCIGPGCTRLARDCDSDHAVE